MDGVRHIQVGQNPAQVTVGDWPRRLAPQPETLPTGFCAFVHVQAALPSKKKPAEAHPHPRANPAQWVVDPLGLPWSQPTNTCSSSSRRCPCAFVAASRFPSQTALFLRGTAYQRPFYQHGRNPDRSNPSRSNATRICCA